MTGLQWKTKGICNPLYQLIIKRVTDKVTKLINLKLFSDKIKLSKRNRGENYSRPTVSLHKNLSNSSK